MDVTRYFKSETYKQKDFTVQSLFDADMDLHMIRSLYFLFQYLFVAAYESMINQLLLGEDDLSSQAHCRSHKTSCFSTGVLIKQPNCGPLKYLAQPLQSSVGGGRSSLSTWVSFLKPTHSSSVTPLLHLTLV